MDVEDVINQRCWRMANLSPLARSSLDNESYRFVLETDDVEAETIQQILYLRVLDDLKDIGVELNCDPSVIYSSNFKLDHFLDLCEWLFPNVVYGKLRSDPKLQTALDAILDGSIGDDDTLHLYLNYLKGDEISAAYCPELIDSITELQSVILSTPLFDRFLNNLLAKIRDEKIAPFTDINQPHLYHHKIQTIVKGIHEAGSTIELILDDAESDRFKRRLYYGYSYALQPDKLNTYGWILSTSRDMLNDDNQKIYDKLSLQIHRGWKLSIEYFTSRQLVLDRVDLAGCVCLVSAQSFGDQKIFTQKMALLRDHVDTTLSEFLTQLETQLNQAV